MSIVSLVCVRYNRGFGVLYPYSALCILWCFSCVSLSLFLLRSLPLSPSVCQSLLFVVVISSFLIAHTPALNHPIHQVMSLSSAVMSASSSFPSLSAADSASALRDVPRLQPGKYASWKPLMKAFFMRHGVKESVYEREQKQWSAMDAKVKELDEASEAQAVGLALGTVSLSSMSDAADAVVKAEVDATVKSTSPSVSSSSSSSSVVSSAVQAHTILTSAQRTMRELVSMSYRAHGLLYTALSDDLRLQVAMLPNGYAYALWKWLENKFQSVEVSTVGDLIKTWMELVMEPDESFDSWRARVDAVNRLLDAAKEKPSRRMYAYVLLDKLQPRFKQAVLALKTGNKYDLSGTVEIDWDKITEFINAFEKNEARIDLTSEEVGSSHKAMQARHVSSISTGNTSWQNSKSKGSDRGSNRPTRDLSKTTCYGCGKLGHLKPNCPTKIRGGNNSQSGSVSNSVEGNSRSNINGTYEQVQAARASNQFTVVLSDESDEDDQYVNRKSGGSKGHVFMVSHTVETYAH